jgi:hypothetical protein
MGMEQGVDSTRLTHVEREVSTIRGEMAGLTKEMGDVRADVRGLGSILGRIEQGVAEAQQRFDNDKLAARINPIAMATVLLSIISILVGGAWLISGELARHDERSAHQQRLLNQIEHRQWGLHGNPA